ncbi:MAG: JAB domain-containing protein [Lachnospiraceae bacterium]|nr:JAB domain-containing protein [Lachnospiraceae bacterium]
MMVKKYGLEVSEIERIPHLVEEGAFYTSVRILQEAAEVEHFCRETLKMDKKAEEYVYLLCFDIKGSVLGLYEISHGDVRSSILSPREICIRALLSGASGMLIVHNHPSGSTEPSLTDEAITQRIYEAGVLINVPLIDSIIIGTAGHYYSFREEQKIIFE